MSHQVDRSSDNERARTADILRLVPPGMQRALDIGARDGHFSLLLAERFPHVTALDLDKPEITHPRVECVRGNAAALDFGSGSFDLVLCAEVLEHIPSPTLEAACGELARVAREFLLIGVPYRQDIRVSRTTCQNCGGRNPPWGHVNRFDEARLLRLFPDFAPAETSFVGTTRQATNWLSTLLMDLGGNPWGTYTQDEPCIHCGRPLSTPPERSFMQKACTRAAVVTRSATERFAAPHANWIHMLLRRRGGAQIT